MRPGRARRRALDLARVAVDPGQLAQRLQRDHPVLDRPRSPAPAHTSAATRRVPPPAARAACAAATTAPTADSPGSGSRPPAGGDVGHRGRRRRQPAAQRDRPPNTASASRRYTASAGRTRRTASAGGSGRRARSGSAADPLGVFGGKDRGDGAAHRIADQHHLSGHPLFLQQLAQLADEERPGLRALPDGPTARGR